MAIIHILVQAMRCITRYEKRAVMKPGPQMRDFMRMYQMFWPAFAEKLRSLHNGG